MSGDGATLDGINISTQIVDKEAEAGGIDTARLVSVSPRTKTSIHIDEAPGDKTSNVFRLPSIAKDNLQSSMISGRKLGDRIKYDIPALIEDSKRRLSARGVSPITKSEIADAIGWANTVLDDKAKESAVTKWSAVDTGRSKTDGPTYVNHGLIPSYIVDLVVLVAGNTPNCDVALRLALRQYDKIVLEVKKMYTHVAEPILESALQMHASKAFAGYVRIVASSKNLDFISTVRGEVIKSWILELEGHVKEMEIIAEYSERIALENVMLKAQIRAKQSMANFHHRGSPGEEKMLAVDDIEEEDP